MMVRSLVILVYIWNLRIGLVTSVELTNYTFVSSRGGEAIKNQKITTSVDQILRKNMRPNSIHESKRQGFSGRYASHRDKRVDEIYGRLVNFSNDDSSIKSSKKSNVIYGKVFRKEKSASQYNWKSMVIFSDTTTSQ